MSRPTYDQARDRLMETNQRANAAGWRGFTQGALFGLVTGLVVGLILTFTGVFTGGAAVAGPMFLSFTSAGLFGLRGAAITRQSAISFERGREQGLQEASLGQAVSNSLGVSQQQTDIARHQNHAAQVEEARAADLLAQIQR